MCCRYFYITYYQWFSIRLPYQKSQDVTCDYQIKLNMICRLYISYRYNTTVGIRNQETLQTVDQKYRNDIYTILFLKIHCRPKRIEWYLEMLNMYNIAEQKQHCAVLTLLFASSHCWSEHRVCCYNKKFMYAVQRVSPLNNFNSMGLRCKKSLFYSRTTILGAHY